MDCPASWLATWKTNRTVNKDRCLTASPTECIDRRETPQLLGASAAIPAFYILRSEPALSDGIFRPPERTEQRPGIADAVVPAASGRFVRSLGLGSFPNQLAARDLCLPT